MKKDFFRIMRKHLKEKKKEQSEQKEELEKN